MNFIFVPFKDWSLTGDWIFISVSIWDPLVSWILWTDETAPSMLPMDPNRPFLLFEVVSYCFAWDWASIRRLLIPLRARMFEDDTFPTLILDYLKVDIYFKNRLFCCSNLPMDLLILLIFACCMLSFSYSTRASKAAALSAYYLSISAILDSEISLPSFVKVVSTFLRIFDLMWGLFFCCLIFFTLLPSGFSNICRSIKPEDGDPS